MQISKLIYVIVLLFSTQLVIAQKSINITGDSLEHIFIRKEILCFQDTKGIYDIKQVASPNFDVRFKPNTGFYPKNVQQASYYWYKIKIRFHQPLPSASSVIEFFDQTTDQITAYMPDAAGNYQQIVAGESIPFGQRILAHKNFEFIINNFSEGERTYYFRIKSKYPVNVIMVYRSLKRFVYYTLAEYISFGVFYGMILIFCLHNILMYFAVRRLQYLYYVMYIVSVGVYEMSVDGIGFQYLWPNAPLLNDYVFGVALYSISLFALVFTKQLLQVKQRNLGLYRLINFTIAARTVFFVYCFCFNNSLFMLKFIDFIPLAIAFYTGITMYRNGFKPARFFIVGYTFLFIGVVIKGIYVLGLGRSLPFWQAHYSLTISFVFEMVFLSFSIGDQVRILRKDKDLAQEEVIQQMKINVDLKDSVNRELEKQVQDRTRKLTLQSEEIQENLATIARQNEDLLHVNEQLALQAAEISRMNVLLAQDNVQLQTKIEKVNDARVLLTEMSYEDFSAKYPDTEHCYKFLAELKWKQGYSCLKCNHTNYCNGRVPYSRRCTKCTYEESVMLNTIFHNTRIPIVKAFYLVYLMYHSKGSISARQLSEKLSLRASTCWAYAIRVKRAMEEQKGFRKHNQKEGWISLVIDKKSSAKAVNA
ncbi:hypothetical protein GCM10027037_23640 [Mucilaginibacter koreensis]